MIKVLLFDVEGTTTAIDFVHKTLFPYAVERMERFVHENATLPAVQAVRAVLQDEEGVAEATLEQIVTALRHWIKIDRKQSALKEIQGLIWDEGYRQGAFKGHVYPDVPTAFAQWRQQGLKLAIYSSGSVHAQKSIFSRSTAGDLTPHISAYFDTAVGGKREAKSYLEIATRLGVSPADVKFYSDIKEELDAAKAAGMETLQVFRESAPQEQGHRAVTSFI